MRTRCECLESRDDDAQAAPEAHRPALAPFVQQYGIRTASLGKMQIHTPLPARADCFLEFYLADCYHIINVASGAVHRAPRLVLVGPHTRRREDLLLAGTLRVFNIRFTAVGFRTLFGIPAKHLTDSAECAVRRVLGPEVHAVADKLAAAQTPAQLWRIAEDFLLARLVVRECAWITGANCSCRQRARDPSWRRERSRSLAARHEISTRQLERLFHEYVGVSPKTFARLARLNFALELGQSGAPAAGRAARLGRHPPATAGFYDQSHMVRDFSAMTGESPDRFLALRQQKP